MSDNLYRVNALQYQLLRAAEINGACAHFRCLQSEEYAAILQNYALSFSFVLYASGYLYLLTHLL